MGTELKVKLKNQVGRRTGVQAGVLMNHLGRLLLLGWISSSHLLSLHHSLKIWNPMNPSPTPSAGLDE